MAALSNQTNLKISKEKPHFFVLIAFSGLAYLLFIPLFVYENLIYLDFWWGMSLNLFVLVTFCFLSDPFYKEFLKRDLQTGLNIKIVLGILSALFLYGIFYLGKEFSDIIFPFAGNQINRIYSLKQGSSGLKIGLLMVFVIGPGEEFFWRGFLQRNWGKRIGKAGGFLLCVILYSLVHLGSGNMILVLAAGVCGLFWGGLFLWKKSVVLAAVSHTVWDILIFIVFPLR